MFYVIKDSLTGRYLDHTYEDFNADILGAKIYLSIHEALNAILETPLPAASEVSKRNSDAWYADNRLIVVELFSEEKFQICYTILRLSLNEPGERYQIVQLLHRLVALGDDWVNLGDLAFTQSTIESRFHKLQNSLSELVHRYPLKYPRLAFDSFTWSSQHLEDPNFEELQQLFAVHAIYGEDFVARVEDVDKQMIRSRQHEHNHRPLFYIFTTEDNEQHLDQLNSMITRMVHLLSMFKGFHLDTLSVFFEQFEQLLTPSSHPAWSTPVVAVERLRQIQQHLQTFLDRVVEPDFKQLFTTWSDEFTGLENTRSPLKPSGVGKFPSYILKNTGDDHDEDLDDTIMTYDPFVFCAAQEAEDDEEPKPSLPRKKFAKKLKRQAPSAKVESEDTFEEDEDFEDDDDV